MSFSDQIIFKIIQEHSGSKLTYGFIASKAMCSQVTVWRVVKRLQIAGKLKVSGGRGRSNGYIYEVV